MTTRSYAFVPADAATARGVMAWISLGVAALIAAGLFSILLVLARTPGVQGLLPEVNLFRIALVIHVDLSVLVWLLCIAASLWRIEAGSRRPRWSLLACALSTVGAALMALSPLLGAAEPLMNNYVPILRHPVFYWGLIVFTAGAAVMMIQAVAAGRWLPAEIGPAQALGYGLRLAAAVGMLALLSLVWSWHGLELIVGTEAYFEYLFWGGGHVLQFTYVLVALVAWIMLLDAGGFRFVLSPRVCMVFLTIAALPVITVPFFYLGHEVVSPGHRLAFTELMKYGGLSCLPLGCAIVASLRHAPAATGTQRVMRAVLYNSLGLFAMGGVIGFLIAGLDVVIPAHYHGSIVGVTLALMGVVYYLLPHCGYPLVTPRVAVWQPWVYGIGQAVHVLGLAWTGGYGVQRKTAGAAQGLDRLGEIVGMGLMGLGGLASVIGGVMFLVVVVAAWWARRTAQR